MIMRFSKIIINVIGDEGESNIASNSGFYNLNPSKGTVLDACGILEIHGKEYIPTWTHLARTIDVNSNYNDIG